MVYGGDGRDEINDGNNSPFEDRDLIYGDGGKDTINVDEINVARQRRRADGPGQGELRRRRGHRDRRPQRRPQGLRERHHQRRSAGRLTTPERLLTAVLIACALAAAGAGCGSDESSTQLSPEAARTTPAPPPDPCLEEPPGLAQDGVNDAQGGSSPGVNACDGPGN